MSRSFSDFLAARFPDEKWCLTPRLTNNQRAKGYTLAIPQARFDALTREWEIETYGAPLKSLRAAAPELLAAADAVDAAMTQYIKTNFSGYAWHVLHVAHVRLTDAAKRARAA